MTALVNIAQQANDLHEQYLAGQLSASEFKELVEDLKIVQQIADELIEALDYVSLLVESRYFDAYFQTTLRAIAFDVCFLLLQCTVDEYHELQEEPEQYVYMTHDQCECQRQITVKTRAAKLLVTLVRSLDGALT